MDDRGVELRRHAVTLLIGLGCVIVVGAVGAVIREALAPVKPQAPIVWQEKK